MLTDEQIKAIKTDIAGLAFICDMHDTGQLVDHVLAKVEAALTSAPSASPAQAGVPVEWAPLPEDAAERRIFDADTSLHGNVRLNIANLLRSFAQTHPGGSYAAQCRIAANEVVKLALPTAPCVDSGSGKGDGEFHTERDDDGELLIDWSPGKGRMVTLSLRDDGRLSYAITWDGEQTHGTVQMPAGSASPAGGEAARPPHPAHCQSCGACPPQHHFGCAASASPATTKTDEKEALEWKPLPEDADERRMFDKGTKLHGDVRINIANFLSISAVAIPGGSLAEQFRIMANEVVKLRPAAPASPAAQTEQKEKGQ